ncbi:class I SAM-dependent methyltransferase [Desulfovibrio litoralis]|uniref:Phospholipid N-methyltransferase n=1 Tax=Desulfovibrio litoralis DSM 11393 TaxID=1121455 RepID=A0A1M7RW93_9BACT|nr:methyltransferase domain-containing protein [Desulfovibrio litoralis]SHN50431.1 Phospholipid N-methyltransferase [Desulfovibrio litoralis DSM 11393]
MKMRQHPLFSNVYSKVNNSNTKLFFKEFCKKPGSVGSICPSSNKLARHMATKVNKGSGLVIELGAGTGVVTQALLKNEAIAKRLMVIEKAPNFALHLQKRFPNAFILQGDAANLSALLPKDSKVDAIVSSLPLRAFPNHLVKAITQEWLKVLEPDGIVIQFTYALYNTKKFIQHGFYESANEIIWANLPPARIQILKALKQ